MLEIKIDITDWEDETKRNELEIKNSQNILEAIDAGERVDSIARAGIVARTKMIANDTLFQPDKILLMNGAEIEVRQLLKRQKQTYEAEDGRSYEIPVYMGAVNVPEENNSGDKAEYPTDDKPGYVHAQSQDGLDRVYAYLTRRIPGHIWNHLVLIAANGGDVESAAEKLKAKIDEFVDRL